MAVCYRMRETRDVYAGMIATSAIGYLLDRTLLLARRRLLALSDKEDP